MRWAAFTSAWISRTQPLKRQLTRLIYFWRSQTPSPNIAFSNKLNSSEHFFRQFPTKMDRRFAPQAHFQEFFIGNIQGNMKRKLHFQALVDERFTILYDWTVYKLVRIKNNWMQTTWLSILTILADEPVFPPECTTWRLMPLPVAFPCHSHAIPERVKERFRMSSSPVCETYRLFCI